MQSSAVSSDDYQTSVIMRHKEPKNKEPSTPDLLNDSANVRTTVDKNRPRSCVNPAPVGYDICPNNSRIELETRRWSGVHLGSKLMQAFDRLVFDDSDDYTDSLENNKPIKTAGIELKVTGGFPCACMCTLTDMLPRLPPLCLFNDCLCAFISSFDFPLCLTFSVCIVFSFSTYYFPVRGYLSYFITRAYISHKWTGNSIGVTL